MLEFGFLDLFKRCDGKGEDDFAAAKIIRSRVFGLLDRWLAVKPMYSEEECDSVETLQRKTEAHELREAAEQKIFLLWLKDELSLRDMEKEKELRAFAEGDDGIPKADDDPKEGEPDFDAPTAAFKKTRPPSLPLEELDPTANEGQSEPPPPSGHSSLLGLPPIPSSLLSDEQLRKMIAQMDALYTPEETLATLGNKPETLADRPMEMEDSDVVTGAPSAATPVAGSLVDGSSSSGGLLLFEDNS